MQKGTFSFEYEAFAPVSGKCPYKLTKSEATVLAAAFRFFAAVKFLLSSFGFFKIQYYTVDAVSQARRWRTVVENVAQMRFAAAAHHLYTVHSKAVVSGFYDGFFTDRLKEARPSAAAFVFGVALEKRVAAYGAVKCANLFGMLVLACERALGTFQARDAVDFRRKDLLPVIIVFFDGRRFGMGILRCF